MVFKYQIIFITQNLCVYLGTNETKTKPNTSTNTKTNINQLTNQTTNKNPLMPDGHVEN